MFLQIYRDSGVEVPEFLQVFHDVYQKDVQSRTDAQEDGPDSLPELPFDVKDVAPYGSLDFSEESLDTINELFEQEGLPLPEGLESKQNDEDVALSDESVIMESSVAQEEDGSGDEDEDDPNRQPPEGAGDVKKYFEDEQLKTEPNTAYFWSGNSNGIGGKEYAMDYAAKNGGITLEGIMKSQGIEMPTWDINDPNAMKAWEYASEIYAGQVSGVVRALIGTSIRPNSVWQTIELKRLMNNPDVTMIIVIDPVTLAETIVFRR